MKEIIVTRGGQKNPLIKEKDTFDSTIFVYNNNKLMFTANYVNTDFCKGYKGGIIKECSCYGIFYKRASGKMAFQLYNENFKTKKVKVSSRDCLSLRDITFTSLIPNPNQDMEKKIEAVLIHSDFYLGGASHGCITIYPEEFNKFVKLFKINEIVKVTITRDLNWTAPAIYEGN